MKRAVCLVALLGVSACVLNGTVIFDNLSETGTGQAALSMMLTEGQKFIAPGDARLQSVVLNMKYNYGGTFNWILAQLYSDADGVPGVLVGSLAPDLSLELMTTLANYTFHPVGTINLEHGDGYWVTVGAGGGATAGWEYTGSTSGTGFPFTSWHSDYYNDGGSYTWHGSAVNPMKMQVNADSGVPEPATLLLVAPLGLAAFALRRRLLYFRG